MRSLSIALISLLAATTSAIAQDYRWEQNDQLAIRFKVHRKLTPVPTQIGSMDPHTKIQFEAGDTADKIRGTWSWYLWILEFPKKSAANNVKPVGEGSTTTAPEDHERDSPLKCNDWNQWVTEKDPHIKDRTYQDKARPEKAKGKTPAFDYWEFSDQNSHDEDSFWYTCAAVYDLPDRQIVLEGVVPAIGKSKPNDNLLKIARTMIASLEVIEVAAADQADADRDKFADTPAKQKELETAKKNIGNLAGWDYFTTPHYICLYSWNPERKDKRKPATDFAHDIVDKLETMRELYEKYFPPHPNMVQLYSILRICENFDDFHKYSGQELGTLGYFSPSSKELVFYDDKDRDFGGDKNYLIYAVAMHEGWHQYGYTYFGEKAELHRWFDEGFGDFFGSWFRKGNKWSYEPSKMRVKGVKEQVARKTFIAPRDLVTWEIAKFYGSPRKVDHYEQSYSMIDFLMRGPEVMGKKFDPSWTKVVDKYREGMLETKDHVKAVQKAFEGVDWEAFEKTWSEWVMRYLK